MTDKHVIDCCELALRAEAENMGIPFYDLPQETARNVAASCADWLHDKIHEMILKPVATHTFVCADCERVFPDGDARDEHYMSDDCPVYCTEEGDRIVSAVCLALNGEGQ